jgi:excinuclease ABC subunit A
MLKQKSIFIKGARANNLKNIDIELPHNQLIVVTGVSGSGKSSLTIDTLYAEGQRRYVESLSSYARQFLGRMKKPEVDFIKGLCPAIAIEQRVGNKNARSTVGTLTEIYDYLRLLYARVGETFSPISGHLVKKYATNDVLNYIFSLADDTRVFLCAPLVVRQHQNLKQLLEYLQEKGFNRVLLDGEQQKIDKLLNANPFIERPKERIKILIDRFLISKNDDELQKRVADSINLAFQEGNGACAVLSEYELDNLVEKSERAFSNKFELDGILFEEPNPQMFNFNSSLGACPICEGYGKVMGIDEEKVIPDKEKTIFEDAVVCWRGEKVSRWKEKLISVAAKNGFAIHKPYKLLTEAQIDFLWNGNKQWAGINGFFDEMKENNQKIQNRVLVSRYSGKTTCKSCKGSRLKKEALLVKILDKTIAQLARMPARLLYKFVNRLEIELSDYQQLIAKRMVYELKLRLKFMLQIGLGYLSIDRLSATLSGGEIQRIHLTRTLGSNLTSSLYVLDEPSIGLHPKDTSRLVQVLKKLRDLGNTVVVVEHDEEVIAESDFLVDVGPFAGVFGGEIVFAGAYKDIQTTAAKSLTAQYMRGDMKIEVPKNRRNFTSFLTMKGANRHNLKNIDVVFPLNVFTVITGVSGSGKTTLVKQLLYPALKAKLENIQGGRYRNSGFSSFEGDFDKITHIEFVNQQPIGRSSRSNPATYIKAYDAIRKLFAEQQLSKVSNFKTKHFSFNVEGGRCETCKGEGETLVSMQFLADVRLTCEDCGGRRFQKMVLEVLYKGKSIYDVLNMSVDEALIFFEEQPDIKNLILPLQQVGLGYVGLGQSSTTLSGGEAQRVKLASFLNKQNNKQHIFFIFDEPTTGLHFHDIQKLLVSFQALVESGHTVLVIEHNLDVVKCADYLIDLGKNGGERGGNLLYQGKPEGLLQNVDSYTAEFLRLKM